MSSELNSSMSHLTTKDMSVKDLKETTIPVKAAAKDEYVPEEGQEDEIFFEIPPLEDLQRDIIDESAPIAKRMRCCFLLKQIGGEAAVNSLSQGLRSPSVLLAHECAYVMGQMQDHSAIPLLTNVLKDDKANPIVRHEVCILLHAPVPLAHSLIRTLLLPPHSRHSSPVEFV